MQLPENWKDLTADQRREFRLNHWADPANFGITDPEVGAKYAERCQMFIDVINLREPARVPRLFPAGGYVAEYAGITHAQAMGDPPKAAEAMIQMCRDFDLDFQPSGEGYAVGVAGALGYRPYEWPGGKLADNQLFQALDDEYMTADQYDQLINDPSAYLWHTYAPTVLPALEGLRGWPSGLGLVELPFIGPTFLGFADPKMREALQALLDAGEKAAAWIGGSMIPGPVVFGELGLPVTLGGFTKVPFDFVGDTLRGTKAIMMDMYRRPEKVMEAIEVFTQPAIDLAVNGATATGNPFIFVVMHKGADGFMSQKDFDKFYMPGFKAILEGMVAQGVVPLNFVEGAYNERLDALAAADLPEKSMLWMFDRTDMAEAKRKVGGWGAVGGNVPSSLYATGTPADMDTYVKKLCDDCMPGGGFFLAPGAVVDQARAENVHAFLKAGLDYGKY